MQQPIANTTNDASVNAGEIQGPPTQTQQIEMMWSGPLPPPQVLASFNDIVPNGAERIIAAWEKETAHRHKMDMRTSTESILGKVFALVFVITALAICGFTAYIGATWVSAVLGGGVIASVVWAFVRVNHKT